MGIGPPKAITVIVPIVVASFDKYTAHISSRDLRKKHHFFYHLTLCRIIRLMSYVEMTKCLVNFVGYTDTTITKKIKAITYVLLSVFGMIKKGILQTDIPSIIMAFITLACYPS